MAKILSLLLLIIVSCGQNDGVEKNSKSEVSDLTTSSDSKNAEKNSKHIFDTKSAKIEFKYTGGPEEGSETLHFDDFGAVCILEIDKKTKYGRTNQTIIWKEKSSTIVDHEKKTVAKSPFRPKATEPPSIADIPEKTRKTIGYEKLPAETIAGKTCEVWFNAKQNIKYCLWNKVDLKLENQGIYTKEAVSVQENISIPATMFEIPKDYKQ